MTPCMHSNTPTSDTNSRGSFRKLLMGRLKVHKKIPGVELQRTLNATQPLSLGRAQA